MMRKCRHPHSAEAPSYAGILLAWVHHYIPHPVNEDVYLDSEPLHANIVDYFFDLCATNETGTQRLHTEAALVLPKKSAKSMVGAALAVACALGPWEPCGIASGGEVFKHGSFRYVYDAGEVMAKPVRGAAVRVVASSKDQAGDTCYNYAWIWLGGSDEESGYSARLLEDYAIRPRDHVAKTKFTSPNGSTISVMAASDSAKRADGGREVLGIFEEGHLLTGSVKETSETIRRNLLAMGGLSFCPTTAYGIGEASYLEDVFDLWKEIEAGRSPKKSLLVHHALPTPGAHDLTTLDGITAALDEAYESAPWRSSSVLAEEFFDPRADIPTLKRLYLGIPSTPSRRWISRERIEAATLTEDLTIPKGAKIALGLDASRGVSTNSDYFADATALVAAVLPESDEEPIVIVPIFIDEPKSLEWQLDTELLDGILQETEKNYHVVASFADPPFIEGILAKHERRVADSLCAFADTRSRPVSFWTNRTGIMGRVTEQYEADLLAGRIKLSNDPTLIDHHVNAHRRPTRSGYTLGKERKYSNQKIDASISSILAYTAARQAISGGALLARRQKRRYTKGAGFKF